MASGSASRTVPKFVHHISGAEAEQLLLTKGFDGSFLVRTSAKDPKVYAVSYRTLNKVTHIKFETTEEGFAVKNLPDEYPTISDLITAVQCTMPGLDYPIWPSDPAPEGLLPRLFFGRLSSKHAEKLLKDPDGQSDRNFIIRSSTTYDDQIAISVRLESGQVVHVLTYRQGDKFLVKGKINCHSFDNFKQLLDFHIEGRVALEQDDGTVIRLMKPMICPWNNDPSGATGNTSTLPSKPATKGHRDVTEKSHKPTSPVYCNVAGKGIGNVYENVK